MMPGTLRSVRNARAIPTMAVLLVVVLVLAVDNARAANHLWHISEVYSNADGTVQFVEMHNDFDGEGFLGGLTLEASNADATDSHTFTFPTGVPNPFATADKYVLIATAGFGSLPGGVTPDFTLPANFLFINGGSLEYPAAADSITYAALPTDGTTSLTRNLTTHDLNPAVNSPTNFAGQSGSVVPEPAVAAPLAAAVAGAMGRGIKRRRR